MVIIPAQDREIRFQHLTIEQGLSQSAAYGIVQDKNGFIWIGTETGLNKYDGYEISLYDFDKNDSNTISNNYIHAVCSDHNGILWIGTEIGLNRFDPQKNQAVRYIHDPAGPGSISHNRILSICEDSSGTVWVGTDGGGLNALDSSGKHFKRYTTDPSNPQSICSNTIYCLYTDRSGGLWIGTDHGLDNYNKNSNRFFHYTYTPGNANCISDNHVTSLLEDRKGVLWVGTEQGGLNRYDHGKKLWNRYTHNPGNPNSLSDEHVTVIYEDRTDRLWIGTNDHGIDLFDRNNSSFTHYVNNPENPHSLSFDRIMSICEDKQGGLWFGTYGGGVNIYYRQMQQFIHVISDRSNSNSLSSNSIRPIYEDKNGILWIGTDGGGLNSFDRKRSRYKHYRNEPGNPNSLSDNRVYAIHEDSAGVMWIGTHGGGLNKFDRKKNKFYHFTHDPRNPASLSNDKIRCIREDHTGGIWIATNGGGLNLFDRKTGRFIRYNHDPDNPGSLSNDKIFSLLVDRENTLWVGTFGCGLDRFDRDKKQFIHYPADSANSNSLQDNFILSIYEDRSGMLWIGTIKEGLYRFDRQKNVFNNITKKDGLPDNNIYDILEDKSGNLWMSTNKGIARYNPILKTINTYDVKDGLQSNEFNLGSAFQATSGELFFGGFNGLNSFFPQDIKNNPYIPPIVITRFLLFNKPVPVGAMANGRTILSKVITETKELTLLHTDNAFSFEFSALNFIFPDKNRYAFMMEGFDKEWNFVGSSRRFASYTGLQPGIYEFKVRGSNNDGVWSNEGTSLKITIIPPFWRTWWFYLLSIIIIVIIAAAAYQHQIEKFKKQKEEEERLKVFADMSYILEQGNATVYRRNFNAEVYEYMGKGITEITGYTPEEFNLSLWRKIVINTEVVDDSCLDAKDALDRMSKGLIDNLITDKELRAKSGEIRWVRDITTSLRDEKGRCFAILGIVFDITDRKLAEQELVRISDELLQSSKEIRTKNKEMKTDLDMAREIQTTVLTKNITRFPVNTPPQQSALEFHHRYFPASSLAGDFFEIIPISDHEVGLFICDVMGHGARASLLTFYMHGLIEELVPVAADPSIVIARLNDSLNSIFSRFATGIFVTAFYGVLDIQTGILRFTDAGHPLPYILRKSNHTVEKLISNEREIDPAIGIHQAYNFTCHCCTLSPDDLVFFYTDGLYEVTGKNKTLFGRLRLADLLRQNIFRLPDQILDAAIMEIKAFSERDEFIDDVCMVSMHVKKLYEAGS